MSAPPFDLRTAIAEHRAAKAAKAANPDPSLAGLAALAGGAVESEISRGADEAERAAIAEIDGGLPRAWAEALAQVTNVRPNGIARPEWARRVAVTWAFADRHAAVLDVAGWTFGEVFGVGDAWWRLDQRGAGWFIGDAAEIEITPDCLRWRTPDGASHTLWRAGRGPHVRGAS